MKESTKTWLIIQLMAITCGAISLIYLAKTQGVNFTLALILLLFANNLGQIKKP